jgi:hypothetical protein
MSWERTNEKGKSFRQIYVKKSDTFWTGKTKERCCMFEKEVRQVGFEPTTRNLVGACSSQLSYWRTIHPARLLLNAQAQSVR